MEACPSSEIKVNLAKVDEKDCRICQLGCRVLLANQALQLSWVALARMIWLLLISNVLRLGSKSREISKKNLFPLHFFVGNTFDYVVVFCSSLFP